MNRTISLPEELLKRAEELASREDMPLEEFLTLKLSEGFAGLEYLKQRSDRADDARFRAALQCVPDVEPDANDRFESS